MAHKIEETEKRTPPPKRTGVCLGVKTGAAACSCRAYDFHGVAGGWSTCWCGHTEQVHALAEGPSK